MRKSLLLFCALASALCMTAQDIRTIPVVFHILHTETSERFTDQEVSAFVEKLNQDFSLTRPDVSSIDGAFFHLAADTRVRFRLATKDPDGQCTNGINRHLISGNNALQDEFTENALPFAWDDKRYLNIFFHPGSGPVTGLSHFPETVTPLNAVHLSSGFSQTEDLTLLVGNWLGLRRLDGPDCTVDTDGIPDTPTRTVFNDCTSPVNACNELQNEDNFMTFSYCPRRMFTQGQRDKIHYYLENSANRAHWKTENLAQTGAGYEVMPTDVLCRVRFFGSYAKGQCAGSSVQFFNESYYAFDSLRWSFPGGIPESSADTNPVVQYASPGAFDVSLKVYKDGEELSVLVPDYVIMVDTAMLGSPYNQDFSSLPQDLSPDFTVENTEGEGWQITGTVGYDDDKSLMLRNYLTTAEGQEDAVYSGTIAAGMEEHSLRFQYAFANRSPSDNDQLEVYLSNDCGITWSRRKVLRGNLLRTAQPTSDEFVPSAGNWKEAEVTFTPTNGQIRFKVLWISGGGNNIYIDRIRLEGVTGGIKTSGPELLSIHPNPAAGVLNISAPDGIGNYTVSVIDLQGREIALLTSGHGALNATTNISALRPGVYVLQLESEKGNSRQRLIVCPE